jgi:hypothetical protein
MNKEEAKKRIDADDASINGVKLITACRAKDIIDAIDDLPKVKLPREVGEELEDWLKTDNIDDILENLVCIYDIDHDAVRDWWDSTLGATYLIADMARYGWEAEPEAKWYVKAPKEWCPEFTFWICKDGSKVYPTLQEYMDYPAFNQQFQFTRAELKKYHFDSDIFTLVPVEEEK